jgi:hypothetical protein
MLETPAGQYIRRAKHDRHTLRCVITRPRPTADLSHSSFLAVQPCRAELCALLHTLPVARTVPDRLAATAQAIYGTVGVGAATALLAVISGLLYAQFGAGAFGVMSMLCLAALPIAHLLSTNGNAASARQ